MVTMRNKKNYPSEIIKYSLVSRELHQDLKYFHIYTSYLKIHIFLVNFQKLLLYFMNLIVEENDISLSAFRNVFHMYS